MVDMLHKQVMKPSDASCKTFMGPRGETFTKNNSIFLNLKTGIQFNSLINAVVESIACVQIRKELAAQSILIATDNLLKSTGTVSEILQAATVTTGTVDADDNYPNLIRAAQLC